MMAQNPNVTWIPGGASQGGEGKSGGGNFLLGLR
jgi:hypothetical protein